MRMRAEISCAVYFLPSISVVQSVPMWRLTEEMVRSTLVTAWRLAISPTRTSPVLEKATTEGVVRAPSALGMMVGSPPSRTAIAELVVPRSMPTARAMVVILSFARPSPLPERLALVCVVSVVPGGSRHILESDVLNFRSGVFIPQPVALKLESAALNFARLALIPSPNPSKRESLKT